MIQNILAIYSNPPGQTRLRLESEDRLLLKLARQYSAQVTLERHHATQIEDIHSLLRDGQYDVIQFSGHGSDKGICLEQDDCTHGEVVSAERLVSLIELSEKPPILVVLLSCYSEHLVSVLAKAAPFVITTPATVPDEDCLVFVQGFYENYFRNAVVSSSFEHTANLLRAKNLDPSNFHLSRRQLNRRNGRAVVESEPLRGRNSILIDIEDVLNVLSRFGMREEELCHQFSRRLRIHLWIFDTPREQVLIPMGNRLFGEFGWEDANDIVHCRRLFRLRADVSQTLWKVWSSLLNTYNDLAACGYRHPDVYPALPQNKSLLEEAVTLFQHHLIKYLLPAQSALVELNATHLEANIVQVTTYVEGASDQLKLGRLPQVVQQLELGLTNYHEVVNGLQPPEEVMA
jgi:hypothetical protein